MPLINTTEIPGSLLVTVTTDYTGSLFLTLLIIMLIMFIVCAAFRMPIELSVIVMFPLLMYSMALSESAYAVGGAAAIYGGVLLAKWFINR